MIYGFVSAAIAGFLLTAVPVWTGSKPLVGAGLAIMALLWAAGRVCMALSSWLPPIAVGLVDLAFLPALVVVLVPPILAARSRRNYGIPAVLLLLALANGLIHLQALGWSARSAAAGLRFAVDLIILLVVVIGGRITPTFTANAFRRAGLEIGVRSSSWLDRLGVASVALLLVIDLVAPGPLPGGVVGLLAAALTGLRMIGWRTLRTLRDPLVWSLHLGYAWVPAGLACRAMGELGGGIPPTTGLHALTAGAFGTMILAVMTRVGLGHTGRALAASGGVAAASLLVTVGALLRVAGPLAFPGFSLEMLVASGMVWATAFALYLLLYWPILTRPRPDGAPG
jgi:uncharacterized protein involved in response to NO